LFFFQEFIEKNFFQGLCRVSNFDYDTLEEIFVVGLIEETWHIVLKQRVLLQRPSSTSQAAIRYEPL
jgi:hypothetical protein